MIKKIILGVAILLILSGRGIGLSYIDEGATIELNPNRKLEAVTWIKSDYFVYLTKRMVKNDDAETYKFEQLLNTYDFNGEVIIVETRDEDRLVEEN